MCTACSRMRPSTSSPTWPTAYNGRTRRSITGSCCSGQQGTGKDTIIEGAIPAVGPWNVAEVSPDQLLGRFNGFVKSVILRVSEARDLGELDRYRLYDHLKTYLAAPPAVLRCDEKNIREYTVPNVMAVVITSNYIDAIYLPPDDRRHYVAHTELTKEDFAPDYFTTCTAGTSRTDTATSPRTWPGSTCPGSIPRHRHRKRTRSGGSWMLAGHRRTRSLPMRSTGSTSRRQRR